MANGNRKGSSAGLISLIVIVLGFGVLNASAGVAPWILLSFGVLIAVLLANAGPRRTAGGRTDLATPRDEPTAVTDPDAPTAEPGPPAQPAPAAAPQVPSSERTPTPNAAPKPNAAPTDPGQPSPDVLARVTELKRSGRTIEAIEVLRQATGMELYEASQFVRKL
ncbi:hypothetical protein [Actinopolymorpha alba]|uniref:hypothetical protein n=1 Tax=Actinopolymorpha alba TaxID=533267 RepID=UPI0003A31D8E|nr:hypothetical protein [Actinopolymorpha alba]